MVTGTALGTGRRKEAIARVRIMPGTGQWRINDRSLEEFFPNKVHQQLISEPFVTLGADNQFDVIARITGGGVTGRAGALRARVVIEMRRPESGDRLIVLFSAAGHDLIEILVFDPAARWGIEPQDLRARGLGNSGAEGLPNRQFRHTSSRP